ncbi:RNA polymerase sigma factor RpoD/SigA [Streptomyces sp. NPDC052013]|uniref:RNA polymerase sigma factor RpoD/SigA n=1 Tax=Streptomyces sp. NPDC052013 TaxID=3365679 RepID=UPI0037D673EA
MADVERRTIEAELPSVIARLRSCASRAGVVSQRAFAAEADRLGLSTDEQRRGLSRGLAEFGIHVKPLRRTPGAAGGTVRAGTPPRRTLVAAGEAAPVQPATPSPAAVRLAQARRMLARYADADGSVGRLAHDGVVRLHGLSAAEARELTAEFPITRPRPPRAAARTVTASGTDRGGASPALPKLPVGKKRAARTTVSAKGDSAADAVRAARAVLDDDRWRRNPGKTILTAEEEVGLAVLLRDGTGGLGRDIPKEEIRELPRTGERWRAYECLVLHNQRLVWKIAQGFQGHGLDIEDLVQHGTLGLMRAVRKFDATKGFKLSTYATWWIKQSITRAIADEGTTIRLPAYIHERVSKVAVAERKLLNEGRPRTVDAVAYATGLTFAQVEEVRRISRPTDSLDRIIGDDTALGDLIIGPSRLPEPPVVALRKELQARLRHVLGHLSERERHVLIRRTGLDGDEPDTLEDIGADFGVTRERIRQIESKAKAKFRGQLIRHGMTRPHR